jgi:hypothetical protein
MSTKIFVDNRTFLGGRTRGHGPRTSPDSISFLACIVSSFQDSRHVVKNANFFATITAIYKWLRNALACVYRRDRFLNLRTPRFHKIQSYLRVL